MRRSSRLLSLLPIVSLSLVACGDGARDASGSGAAGGGGGASGSSTSTSAGRGTGAASGGGTATGGGPTGGGGGALTAPRHFLTWDYYDESYGANPAGDNGVAHAVSLDDAAKWLNWSDASVASTPQLQQRGVKGYLYTMPTIMELDDEFYDQLVESDFAHDCGGNRLASAAGYGYVTEPHSPHLLSAWQAYVNSKSQGFTYDAVFEDAAGGAEATGACNYDENEWHEALVKFASSIHPHAIPNGLGPHYLGNGAFDLPWMLQYNESNIVGQRNEVCYTEPYNPSVDLKVYGSMWTAQENIELAMAKAKKLCLCMAGFNAPVADADTDATRDVRLYVLASFLLTYDLDTSMLGMGFTTPSRFHVEPESQLVPLAPLAPTPDTIDALKDAGGAYLREYDACFFAGAEVGPCAVIVNSDPSVSAPLPPTHHAYQHTLVLAGGGVLDGSTATLDGSAPPATVPPVTGIIAF